MLARLRDGTAVLIRPIRPDDKALLRAGVACASPESLRRRFLTPKPALSQRELSYLTEVDGRDHVAFVAVAMDEPRRLLGVGRWVRLADDPQTAEAAVIIADAVQGQGLGRIIGLRLADEARWLGIKRFAATILDENVAARRLMRTLTERLEQGPGAGGVHELVGELAA
jgi:acetyltransferase